MKRSGVLGLVALLLAVFAGYGIWSTWFRGTETLIATRGEAEPPNATTKRPNATSQSAPLPGAPHEDRSFARQTQPPGSLGPTPGAAKPHVAHSALQVRFAPGPATAYLPGLIRAADAGDVDAAAQSGLLLSHCKRFLATAEAMKSIVASQGKPLQPDQNGMATQFEQDQARCSGISVEDLNKRVGLLEFAADHGDERAQLAYPFEASEILMDPGAMLKNPEQVMAYKQKTFQYLYAATLSGNVEAMNILATAYRDGSLVAPDPVQAYAYHYAVNGTGLQNSQSMLDFLRDSMTPEQVRAGEQVGQQILSRCCR